MWREGCRGLVRRRSGPSHTRHHPAQSGPWPGAQSMRHWCPRRAAAPPSGCITYISSYPQQLPAVQHAATAEEACPCLPPANPASPPPPPVPHRQPHRGGRACVLHHRGPPPPHHRRRAQPHVRLRRLRLRHALRRLRLWLPPGVRDPRALPGRLPHLPAGHAGGRRYLRPREGKGPGGAPWGPGLLPVGAPCGASCGKRGPPSF
jgi:hypothetical protein